MKRRRQLLQVSTFPFLAVLLCAMGALILVLLSMDRKAKLAALQKAQLQQRAMAADHARAAADRAAASEARARAAWERKRDALRRRLDDEEKAVQAELAAVRARLNEAGRKLRVEEERSRELQKRLQEERGALEEQQAELAESRGKAKELAERASAAEKERASLQRDLKRLEKELKELREARAEGPARYSVVPYFGRQGGDRRPLYVECGADGVVFHPEKKALADAKRPELRAEVERRLAEQKEARPYLMILVRPEGIKRYYEVQAVARELSVDFGYELIDADWKLDYSREKEPAKRPAPARVAKEGPSLGPPVVGAAVKPRRVTGLASMAVLSRPLPFGSDLLDPPQGGAPPAETKAAAAGAKGCTADIGRPLPAPPSGAKAEKAGSPARPAGDARREPDGPAMSPPPDGAPKRDVALRPAAISADVETVIFVECRRDLALVYPTGRRVPIDTLNHSPAYNPLLRAVNGIVTRRKTMAPPGGPAPRFQVRFLVHRDGVETYHLSYPALGPVAAEKKAYWLGPGDDVGQIVAGP